ncbi:BREX-1 system phosphatase PglZ type A [Pectinatus frisingensis]|uniref:BREX-1 system phosphatase PglZ type A n=1 Tax=Pectinatus frisingensis TaxID=865 RepID=UPI0018C7B7C4|nr:BREX-1 system phosphatase PglZ type A [Pectinatus frisingensis]
MDTDKVIQDLNRRFAEPLPEFYHRRLIFWYDDEHEFEDKINEITLNNAKVIVLTGSNNFAVKKLLSVDDKINNYLVYSPLSYDKPDEDWLINIELYSEEFRADLNSIWMSEMNLPNSPVIRKQVKVYRKFFNAKDRRAKVAALNNNITTAAQMHLVVMAAICGIKDMHPNSIIHAVISAGLVMETNCIYQDFVTYGADKAFWMMVVKATGYNEGDDCDLRRLAVHVLLTAATRTMKSENLAGLDSFISIPHQAYCYDFISDWLHSDDNTQLFDLARCAEEEVKLPQRFEKLALEELMETECFPCINEVILIKIMTEISNQIISVDVIRNIVEQRRTMAWYDKVACFYDDILQVANMQQFFLDHSAGFHTVNTKSVWQKYTDDYYKMDTYYRQYHLCFQKSLTNGNYLIDDLFKHVTEKVEGLYKNWFLGQLGANWSDVCAENLEQYGRILDVSQQIDFYNDYVKQSDNRVFVIISDALRFEVASSLAEQLRRETQSKVELKSCAAIFPTITKFGMAALLPHKKLDVVEKTNGGLQVLADGQSTESTNRDKVLKNTDAASVALQYKNIIGMKRAERSALVKGMDVVYIYHDKVDEASHTSDNAVFPACDDAITEIKNLVRIIVNDFGGTKIYITADHGFLYTYSPLTEDDKVDKTTPTEYDVEIDRRYLITRKGAKPDYLLPVKFLGGNTDYDAFVPRENVRIKKKGGGMNFVHGGISLQEMVVPVIDYSYLRNASKTYKRNKDKYDTKPVTINLLSASRKISNMIFSLNFYQKEAVSDNREAATYLLYFTDASGRQISDTQKIIADKTSDNGQDRTFRCSFNLKSLKYSNTDSYYLNIADESGLQLPQREEFQIDIAFAVDEFDFFN